MNIAYRLCAVLTLACTFTGLAWAGGASGQSREVRSARVEFAELVRQEQAAHAQAPRRSMHRPMRLPRPTDAPGAAAGSAAPASSSPSAPSTAAPLSPALGTNFQALPDSLTIIPPDTQGAVGPNHVMTTLNSQVLIQNRSGQTVMGPVSLATFWSAVGASLPFDPRLIYEPYSNRWIVSAADAPNSANSRLLIGVSAGPDPTGAWYLFAVRTDATGATWADYPVIGFNKDWVVLTANLFTVGSAPAFSSQTILVFKKADLYANVGATHTTLSNSVGGLVPALTYDNTASGIYLLQDYDGTGGYTRLFRITGAIGAETINFVTTGPGPNGQGFVQFPAGGGAASPTSDFLPQAGTSIKIDSGDTRVTGLVYRNANLWAMQTVFLPSAAPTHSALQWWQMSTAGKVAQSGRIEDTTGAKSYAFGSIAVNRNDDAAIGFSEFSATQYAEGGYVFRKSTDALGTFQPETLLKAGEGIYNKTFGSLANRWGDYSSTAVDPLNDTDFWTLQEYAATPASPATTDGNGRWGTWWGFIQAPRTASSTALAANPASSAFGQSVALTATVTGAAPTGSVQFKDGANNLGAPVSLVSGVATLNVATLTIGTHALSAAYSGDGNNTVSNSNSVSEPVSPPPATVTLGASATSISYGLPITFTATVTGTAPTGTVQFLDNSTPIGGPINLVSGAASLTTSALTSGSHTITAAYSGDADNGAATSNAIAETVLKVASTTGLSASLASIGVGEPVTFTATVAGASPTGSVQFLDGATALAAPVALVNGVATLSTNALSEGIHPITAAYSGDGNNQSSVSPALSETVNGAAVGADGDAPLPIWAMALLGVGMFRVLRRYRLG